VRAGALRGDDAVAAFETGDALEWLRGREAVSAVCEAGVAPVGPAVSHDTVRLLAPVPDPPSIRDFYAYEGHVAAGFRRRGGQIPPAWYEAPVFYFTNPAAVFGPDEAITRPPGCEMLDFELEIAAVLDDRGEIAGFMLMNDWSARDLQRREMTVGLGPAKGKDFATSLGPWIATPDELPFDGERLDLVATVTVNGSVVAQAPSAPMHFSWPALVEQARRGTRLRAGDVLGSGTLTGGCLLELGPIFEGRWIEPGDEVVLSAPGLGELRTPVR
jgi:fumarylacetoacetate (FAA) hydrolase